MIIVCENNTGFINVNSKDTYWVDVVFDEKRGVFLVVLRFSGDDTSKILATCGKEEHACEIVAKLLVGIENLNDVIRINDIKPRISSRVVS